MGFQISWSNKFSSSFEAIPPFKGTYPCVSTICIYNNSSTNLQRGKDQY